ncbi:MAG: hypothetical protein JSU70_05445, partial [Phycisphaerales bacterium]
MKTVRILASLASLMVLGIGVRTAVADAPDPADGSILFEWWDGIFGYMVEHLTEHPHYKEDPPDETEHRISFEGPENRAENYGTRVRGYVHPPTTGDYTFWISSDDYSQLWLSPENDNPAEKVQIASVPGWAEEARQWGKYPEQRSELIPMVAGRRYYIEALHKEGGIDDHLAVAWAGPGIPGPQVIRGEYLSPWIRSTRERTDVTSPGDRLKGVPNNGNWPGGEEPALAIDDNTGTKYLHFNGDLDPDLGPSGFQVTPMAGPSIVTGLTFTTANDFPGRDPIAFKLYGSNDGLDGPYKLIAAGDI